MVRAVRGSGSKGSGKSKARVQARGASGKSKSTAAGNSRSWRAKVSEFAGVTDDGLKRGFLAPTTWGLFGGFFMLIGFPAVEFWPGVIIGLVALVLGTSQRRLGWALWSALLWGCGFFIPHIYWAKISVGSYAPWLALALIQVAYVLVWAVLVAWSRRWTASLWVRVPLFSLSWAGIEQLRGCFPYTGFPWAFVAYSQVDSPLGRLARWGGEVAVSAATMAVAVLIAAAIGVSSRHVGKAPRLLAGAVAVIIFIFPLFTISLPTGEQDGNLGVAAIQGNVDSIEDFADPIKVTNNHIAETDQAMTSIPSDNHVDLIVWGENALSADPRQSGENSRAMERLARQYQIPILAGAVRYSGKHRFNDYLEFDTSGQVVGSYTKQVPVPFGEYIPNREFYAKLSSDVNQIKVDMLPGTQPAVIPVSIGRLGREVPVGTGICFEVAVDWVMRGAVKNGAELLVIPTNNTTFGYSAESDQQLQMLRFRAIEYGRAGIQVSTQGKSGVVMPDGTLIDYTQLFKPDYLYGWLPLRTEQTWAVTTAPILRWIAFGAIGLIMVLNVGFSVRGRKN